MWTRRIRSMGHGCRPAVLGVLLIAGCGDDFTMGGTGSGSSSTSGSSTSDPTPGGLTGSADTGSTSAEGTGTTTTEADTTGSATTLAQTGSSSSSGTTGETTDTTDTTGGLDTSSSGSSSSSSTGPGLECGNGVLEAGEACDGDELGGASCPVLGTVSCADDCTLDVSACTDQLIVCASPDALLDDVTTSAETPLTDQIDVAQALFVTDVDVPLSVTHPAVDELSARLVGPDSSTGVLLFAMPCDATGDIDAVFDDDGLPLDCSPVSPAIGGDVVPSGDAQALVGIWAAGAWTLEVWDEVPGNAGTLDSWCVELTLSVDDPVTCGDDQAMFGEACDGLDLSGASCADQDGFVAGTLACADDCTLDVSGCVAAGCGNDILEPDTEDCDGPELDGMSCADVGSFVGGALACAGDCTFDTSGCIEPGCGNGIIESGVETCEGADLGGGSCASLGWNGGTLSCDPVTCTYVEDACFSVCGDDVASADEDCDGSAVAGATCEAQGFVGGTLGCLGDCTLDTSECSNALLAYCSAPGLDIPDTVPLLDTVTVLEDVTVGDVDVFVDITHSWNGDLEVSLESPAATSALLIDDTCSFSDDVFAFFNDEAPGAPDCVAVPGIEGPVTPLQSLSTFDGEDAMGPWTLSVFDDSDFDDNGDLEAWCVYITPS